MFLEHVNMSVANLEESIAFYRNLLGLEVRWQGGRANGGRAAHIGDNRHYLALFEVGQGPRPDDSYDRLGLNHFGFVVDDLAEAKRRLAAMNVEPTMEANYEPGRRLYFMDPNGIEVELVEYANTANAAGSNHDRQVAA